MVQLSFLIATLATVATAGSVTCGVGSNCPADLPCCSQYGECGVGAYCLGGCDPLLSNTLNSCVPEPVCKSKTYNFKDMTGITSKTKYLGDPSTTDWVMDGVAVPYDNTMLLTMAPGTVGTVLASSSYMWYGNVKATFKTSRTQGVVTAFILLSDVKDEIDYEFVGSDLIHAQTNYYFQGITNFDQGANIKLSDTFNNYHTYEIQWTPETLTWLIDGQVARVRNRADTWNATSNQYAYPQTPARVQLSIWPGGLASNAPGTIAWAGGVIDWNAPDIKTNGYFYAQFQSVTVDCYNASSAPGTNKGTSYYYNNLAGTNNTVVDSNKPTVLKSLLGTGTNMSADYASAAGASASSAVAVIPGLTGAGPGTDGHAGDSESSSAAAPSATPTSNSGSGNGGSGGAAPPPSPAGGSSDPAATGFSQGNANNAASTPAAGNKSEGAVVADKSTLRGSVFAGIVAVAVLLAL